MGRLNHDSGPAASPLLELLLDAQEADLEFIIGVLKSPLNLSADGVMDKAIRRYRREGSAEAKQALSRILEREIRYAGSSEIAYLARWLWTDEAGVQPDKLLAEVAQKLEVKVRTIGSFDAKLKRLVRAVVEKELFEMTPEQQRDLMASQDVGVSATQEIVHHLKQKGPVGAIPLLMILAGREAAEKIVTTLVVRVIAIAVGREAASHLIATLAARFPWWAEWIGPAVWAVTGAWVAVDLQGPAFRKTIPAMLYLGLVALRDHKTDGGFFDG